jgi:ubiquinone/menaquinone biosynthesis C-methylase UbiE
MGLYSRFVLPRLIDLAMKDKATTRCRSRVIPRAKGNVLDVGIGSGLNLPFYGPEVIRVFGIDPSPELLAMAGRKPRGLPFPVELLRGSAEQLPCDAGSIATIVLTWTLCTIPEPDRALREMKRVSHPRGRLILAEHGASPDPKVQAWQRRLNPIWKRLAGGCNVDRKIDDLLIRGGFDILELQTSYFPGPRFLTYTFQGVAQ